MRKYIHDYYTEENYNRKCSKYSTPSDDLEGYFNCYFWDVDLNLKEYKIRTYKNTVDYSPVAKMKLRHIPIVGMYLNFNSEIYIVKAVCITGREHAKYGTDIFYDIEVQKVEEGEEEI